MARARRHNFHSDNDSLVLLRAGSMLFAYDGATLWIRFEMAGHASGGISKGSMSFLESRRQYRRRQRERREREKVQVHA